MRSVRSGIMEFLKALLGTVCITEQAENEHGLEQLEYNGTHGVVTTGFESALVDNILWSITAPSIPCRLVQPQTRSAGRGRVQVCLFVFQIGLTRRFSGFLDSRARCMVEVFS